MGAVTMTYTAAATTARKTAVQNRPFADITYPFFVKIRENEIYYSRIVAHIDNLRKSATIEQ
jgi:hypothetical protein